MKTVLLIILTILSIVPLARSDGEFPPQTQKTLQNLSDWEMAEKVVLDKAIQNKRDAVVAVLKQHLKRSTQSGDLKAANLIQSEIEKLSAIAVVELKSKEEVKPQEGRMGKLSKSRLRKEICNGVWVQDEGNASYTDKMKFREDGVVDVLNKAGNIHSPHWRLDGRSLQLDNSSTGTWADMGVSENGRKVSFSMDGHEWRLKRDPTLKELFSADSFPNTSALKLEKTYALDNGDTRIISYVFFDDGSGKVSDNNGGTYVKAQLWRIEDGNVQMNLAGWREVEVSEKGKELTIKSSKTQEKLIYRK